MTTPAITTKGQAVILGFNGLLYTGMQMDDASESPEAEQGFIADENDNDATMLTSDVSRKFNLNGTILASADEIGDLRDMEIGDFITINSIVCIVLDVDLKFQRLEAKGTISAENVPAIVA